MMKVKVQARVYIEIMEGGLQDREVIHIEGSSVDDVMDKIYDISLDNTLRDKLKLMEVLV